MDIFCKHGNAVFSEEWTASKALNYRFMYRTLLYRMLYGKNEQSIGVAVHCTHYLFSAYQQKYIAKQLEKIDDIPKAFRISLDAHSCLWSCPLILQETTIAISLSGSTKLRSTQAELIVPRGKFHQESLVYNVTGYCNNNLLIIVICSITYGDLNDNLIKPTNKVSLHIAYAYGQCW